MPKTLCDVNRFVERFRSKIAMSNRSTDDALALHTQGDINEAIAEAVDASFVTIEPDTPEPKPKPKPTNLEPLKGEQDFGTIGAYARYLINNGCEVYITRSHGRPDTYEVIRASNNGCWCREQGFVSSKIWWCQWSWFGRCRVTYKDPK